MLALGDNPRAKRDIFGNGSSLGQGNGIRSDVSGWQYGFGFLLTRKSSQAA